MKLQRFNNEIGEKPKTLGNNIIVKLHFGKLSEERGERFHKDTRIWRKDTEENEEECDMKKNS